MVIVFLRGGLGNQMFQYAAGLSLARRNKAELLLDTVYLHDRFPRPQFTYRVFNLDIFDSKTDVTALSHAASKVPVPGVWLGLDLAAMNIRRAFGMLNVVHEDERKGFDPSMLETQGNTVLYGRWESEKYFSEIESEVRERFRFKDTITGDAKIIADRIRAENSVSVFIRRGDYVNFKRVRSVMNELTMEYYDRAFRYVAERVDSPRFFVFSDDIAWCKENFKPSFPVTYVGNELAGPKFSYQMQSIALCKHNIIANSTFAWWGAWLNENPRKIVVAPKMWQKQSEEKNRDIIARGWVTL